MVINLPSSWGSSSHNIATETDTPASILSVKAAPIDTPSIKLCRPSPNMIIHATGSTLPSSWSPCPWAWRFLLLLIRLLLSGWSCSYDRQYHTVFQYKIITLNRALTLVNSLRQLHLEFNCKQIISKNKSMDLHS